LPSSLPTVLLFGATPTMPRTVAVVTFPAMPSAVVLRADAHYGPAVCQRLEAEGYAVHAMPSADVARTTIGAAIASGPRMEVLVTLPPPLPKGPVVGGSVEQFGAALESGLFGAFSACREAARLAVRDGAALTIVHVASVLAEVGLAGRSADACVSAGLVAMTKALAAEWAPEGIRVVAVLVGPTTDWTEEQGGPVDVPGVLPAGRLVTAEDVAAGVSALIDPSLEVVNGHALVVDGGWLAHGWRRD
jgi:2-dehydro-3-deoxy-D-gluconate 5-dehydrogenase